MVSPIVMSTTHARCTGRRGTTRSLPGHPVMESHSLAGMGCHARQLWYTVVVASSILSEVGQVLSHRYLTLATRFVLGGVFFFAGVAKLGQLPDFVQLVYQYDIFPWYSLAQVYGYALPFVEVAIGAFLILGLLLRISSVVSILIVVSFIVAKSVALARGMNIGCGCFGEAAVMLVSQSLIVDFFDLSMSIQILFHRGELLALGPWLKQRRAVRDSPT
jgi:uncharacterized membrane protein YphA (DoxX/SURF4 family)